MKRSMSRSVTSHRFATTHGLPAARHAASGPATAAALAGRVGAPTLVTACGAFKRADEQPMSSEVGTPRRSVSLDSTPDPAA